VLSGGEGAVLSGGEGAVLSVSSAPPPTSAHSWTTLCACKCSSWRFGARVPRLTLGQLSHSNAIKWHSLAIKCTREAIKCTREAIKCTH